MSDTQWIKGLVDRLAAEAKENPNFFPAARNDRRCRAALFNALKQEGHRKISIRDNGDGTARIRYKEAKPETLTTAAEKIR